MIIIKTKKQKVKNKITKKNIYNCKKYKKDKNKLHKYYKKIINGGANELNNTLLIGHVLYPNFTNDEQFNTKLRLNDIFNYSDENNTQSKIDEIFEFVLRLSMGNVYSVSNIYNMGALTSNKKNAIIATIKKVKPENIYKLIDETLFFNNCIPLLSSIFGIRINYSNNTNNNTNTNQFYMNVRDALNKKVNKKYGWKLILNLPIIFEFVFWNTVSTYNDTKSELTIIFNNIIDNLEKTLTQINYFINKYTNITENNNNNDNDNDKYSILNADMLKGGIDKHIFKQILQTYFKKKFNVPQTGGNAINFMKKLGTSFFGLSYSIFSYGKNYIFNLGNNIDTIIDMLTNNNILNLDKINNLLKKNIWSEKSLNLLRIIIEFNSMEVSNSKKRTEYINNIVDKQNTDDDTKKWRKNTLISIYNRIYGNGIENNKPYFINHHLFKNVSSIFGINNIESNNQINDVFVKVLVTLPRDILLFILNMPYDDTKLIYEILKNALLDMNGIFMNLFKMMEMNDIIYELGLPNLLNIKTWHNKYLYNYNKKVCLVKKNYNINKISKYTDDVSSTDNFLETKKYKHEESIIKKLKAKNGMMLIERDLELVILDTSSIGNKDEYKIITEFNPNLNENHYKFINVDKTKEDIKKLCENFREFLKLKKDEHNTDISKLEETLISMVNYDDNKINNMSSTKKEDKQKAIIMLDKIVKELELEKHNIPKNELNIIINLFDSIINSTKYTCIIGNEYGKVNNVIDNIFKEDFRPYEDYLLKTIDLKKDDKDEVNGYEINELTSLTCFNNPFKVGLYKSLKLFINICDEILENIDKKIDTYGDKDEIAKNINEKYNKHLDDTVNNGTNDNNYKTQEKNLNMMNNELGIQLTTGETLKDGGKKDKHKSKKNKKKYMKVSTKRL